jgi:hypothetical protein
MKFTFKTIKSTGKYKSFFANQNIVKLNKKEVGSIDDSAPFKVRLQVEKDDILNDKNPNCSWKWITFKKEFISLDEAKEWLNNNADNIISNFKIHYSED